MNLAELIINLNLDSDEEHALLENILKNEKNTNHSNIENMK